jgi:hypothetical protein
MVTEKTPAGNSTYPKLASGLPVANCFFNGVNILLQFANSVCTFNYRL